jgi:hypothetical protein
MRTDDALQLSYDPHDRSQSDGNSSSISSPSLVFSDKLSFSSCVGRGTTLCESTVDGHGHSPSHTSGTAGGSDSDGAFRSQEISGNTAENLHSQALVDDSGMSFEDFTIAPPDYNHSSGFGELFNAPCDDFEQDFGQPFATSGDDPLVVGFLTDGTDRIREGVEPPPTQQLSGCLCNTTASCFLEDKPVQLSAQLHQQRCLLALIQKSLRCDRCRSDSCALMAIILAARDLVDAVPATTEGLLGSQLEDIAGGLEISAARDRRQFAGEIISLQLRPLYDALEDIWNIVQGKQLKLHVRLVERLCERFRSVWTVYVLGDGFPTRDSMAKE